MKKIIIFSAIFLLSSCGSTVNKFSKKLDGLSAGDYKISVYSGGQVIKTYDIKNSFVNKENDTDGYYFYTNGKLVRVSGTVIVEGQ